MAFRDTPLGQYLWSALREVSGGQHADVRTQVDEMAALATRVCARGNVVRDHETGSVIVWHRARGPSRERPVFLDAHLDTSFDLPAGRKPAPWFDERGYLHSPWLDNRVGCAILLSVGAKWAQLEQTAQRDLALIFPGYEEQGGRGRPTGAAVIARRYDWAEGAVFDVSEGVEPHGRRPVAGDMTAWGYSNGMLRIQTARIGWGPTIQRKGAPWPLVVWERPTLRSWQRTDKTMPPGQYPNDIRWYAAAGVSRLRYVAIGVAGDMHSADSWAATADIEQAAEAMLLFAREMTSK